jgi:CDP-diacylglycerol--glycerol-3-phosphate 3-phosphatidyltransferase
MRITANQVTLARLILMPMLCGMIYGDHVTQTWALFVGTFVSATDFIDGYLARKQGPTVLGGLMDPIADKVFISVCFVPYADRGYVAWPLVAALFLREYLVTALRSSFEQRQRQLRSTYMSKVKTWVQMSSLALILIMVLVKSHTVLSVMFLCMAIIPLLLGIAFYAIKRRHWVGAWLGTVLHAIFALVFYLRGAQETIWVSVILMVLLTWVSAIDYVTAAVAVVKAPTLFDLSRLLPAAALPLLGMFALTHGQAPAWSVIAVLAIEFAHGGLDNLVAHHQAAAPWWVWGGRLAVTITALALTLVLPAHATLLGSIAVAVSLAGTVATFWSRRRYYLEPKLRDKKRSLPEPVT